VADKNVAIDGDVYEFIIDQAKKNHRTLKGQIAYMVGIYRNNIETDGTQVSMPETSEEREAALERIR
jgi:hypothetical protein